MTNREWIEERLADFAEEHSGSSEHCWLCCAKRPCECERLIAFARVALAGVDERHPQSDTLRGLRLNHWCPCGQPKHLDQPCPSKDREESKLAEALGKR